MDSKLHPAVTVSNIKNFIPITLEMETGQYVPWSELLKIHCRAFQVFDHLQPPSASSNTNKTKAIQPDVTWDRLDAIVLQWIYGTISNDLLHTILKPNCTAYDAWTALESLFQDIKSSFAIYLDHKFANTRLDDFSNMSAYCQALKVLAVQLDNVNSPVSNQRLVLQLIAGLNDEYKGIAMLLQHSTPLPDFYDARSRLCMEESRKAYQAMNLSSADRACGPGLAQGPGRGRGSGGRRFSSQVQQPVGFSPWAPYSHTWAGSNTGFQQQTWPQWTSSPYPNAPQPGSRPAYSNVASYPDPLDQSGQVYT